MHLPLPLYINTGELHTYRKRGASPNSGHFEDSDLNLNSLVALWVHAIKQQHYHSTLNPDTSPFHFASESLLLFFFRGKREDVEIL